MPANAILRERFEVSQRLYADLVAFLPETQLASKLPGLPSNSIGQQLWCVIGARESYSKAIGSGSWQGFSCSLKDANVKADVAAALLSSTAMLSGVLSKTGSLSDAQNSLALQLLEHEVQHHGQLIRFLYGLRLGIPASWKDRYHLD